MIFLNRRRNLNGIKNPSKYWYVEKYVYGELKETVEVPLGTSIKFEGIDSGYSDDTFYGWSVNSTSVSSTFNSTSAYSNSAGKNYLDDKNTLKIYAVYSYIDDSKISNARVEIKEYNSPIIVKLTSGYYTRALFEGYTTNVYANPATARPTIEDGVIHWNSVVRVNGKTLSQLGSTVISSGRGETFYVELHNGDEIISLIDYKSDPVPYKPRNDYYYYKYVTVPHIERVVKYRILSHTV